MLSQELCWVKFTSPSAVYKSRFQLGIQSIFFCIILPSFLSLHHCNSGLSLGSQPTRPSFYLSTFLHILCKKPTVPTTTRIFIWWNKNMQSLMQSLPTLVLIGIKHFFNEGINPDVWTCWNVHWQPIFLKFQLPVFFHDTFVGHTLYVFSNVLVNPLSPRDSRDFNCIILLPVTICVLMGIRWIHFMLILNIHILH